MTAKQAKEKAKYKARSENQIEMGKIILTKKIKKTPYFCIITKKYTAWIF